MKYEAQDVDTTRNSSHLEYNLISRAPEGEVTLIERHGTGPSDSEEEEDRGPK